MARSLRYFILLLLLGIGTGAFAQTGEISGTITDETGETFVNAYISVFEGGILKGTAVSDFDGKYVVKPLQPANYNVVIKALNKKEVRISDVRVPASGGIVLLNQKVEPTTKGDLEVVTIVKEKDIVNKTGGALNTFSGAEIGRLPTRTPTDAAVLTPGAVQQKSNSTSFNLGGARTSGTLYYIDGVQVNGGNGVLLPPGAIDQLEIITSGLPARYGDASGGVINLTTRGVSKSYAGGITAEHSVEGYNNNLVSFNLSGPLMSRNDKQGNRRPVLGFLLAGDYRYNRDSDPSYNGNYALRDGLLDSLRQNPLAVSLTPSGRVPKSSTEYVTANDLVKEKARVNADNQRINLTGKLNYELAPGTNLTVGGGYNRNQYYNYVLSNSLFAPDAMSRVNLRTARGYVRFQQRFGRAAAIQTDTGAARRENSIQNAFYSVQADYQQDIQTNQDPNHGHDAFLYGYVGKFTEKFANTYTPDLDTASGRIGIKRLVQRTGVDFERAEYNPYLANYTSSYYNMGFTPPTSVASNGQGGLFYTNGVIPNQTYSLWRPNGFYQTGYSDAKADQFAFTVDASFDYKLKSSTHAISFGLYYQQRAERTYQLSAYRLWNLMRQLTSQVVNGDPDLANPTYVVGGKYYTKQDLRNGVPFGPGDTILYNFAHNDSAGRVGGFDYNLRQKLGAPKDAYLQPSMYDPSTFSLGMFAPDELLNGGKGTDIVNYYGYDYTGNQINGQINYNDFWTKKDANGNYTRPIGAFRPNYIAGYLSDQIRFKDIIFTLGVRVERYDANTKVLKDPYSFYETRTVGQLNSVGTVTPSNIGADAIPYVSDNNSSNPSIVGYRSGDTWYSRDGREVSSYLVLRNQTGGRDPQPYLLNPNDKKITDDGFAPEKTFTDYKPVVNAMPRISFSFPLNDAALFYAHYDVIFQRPKAGLSTVLTGSTGAYASPIEYTYLSQNPNGIIGNPNLRPERNINYEVGYQQQLSRRSGLTLNVFYRERRDQIAVRPFIGAFPITYNTFRNIDFSTTKGLGVKYELRRTNNLSMTVSYTLQFADGTGSTSTSSNAGDANFVSTGGLLTSLIAAQVPNLLITSALDYDSRHLIAVNLDYRYSDNEGPQIFGIKPLQNTGLNILMTARSGEPYTRLNNPQSIQTGININNEIQNGLAGSRLSGHFMLNAKLDKDFALNFINRKKRDGEVERGVNGNRRYSLNGYVYVQNLLNTRDVLTVYRYTSQPDNDGFLASPQGQTSIRNQTSAQAFQDLYTARMYEPSYYNNPRRIWLGIQFNF